MIFNIRRTTLVYVLIGIIVVMGIFLFYQWDSAYPDCDFLNFVNDSVTVKTSEGRILLGMNADHDSLKFGVVSQGTQVRRSVSARNDKKAVVTIIQKGSIAPWVSAEPSTFVVQPNESKEVFFTLNVPIDAAKGDYVGKALFCFNEEK